jgi:hypothetical protein
MYQIVQIFAITLVAIAMAPALAHAFEFPGKMRLSKEFYVATQAIYYPGFTIAGVSEPAGTIAVIALLLLTPRETAAFWLTVSALVGLVGMQIVFWTLTQPTNKYWLQSAKTTLGKMGASFFGLDPAAKSSARNETIEKDWTQLRSRWEYSHISRAILVFLSLLSLVLAIVNQC